MVRWDYLPGKQTEQLEREIVSEIIPALQRTGWMCSQVENKKRIKKGFSDWVLIRRARVIFAEFKNRTGTQSPEQVEFMQQIRQHGGEYRLIRSLGDVIDLLK
jgi:hypothetical protein